MTTLFNLRPHTPNIGNELMAVGMTTALRSVFKNDVTLVTMPASGGGIKAAGLTRKSVYEINQLADGVIVGPGNLFENGALDVDTAALAALATPILVFGVSMGRVFDRTGELVLRTDSSTPDHTRAVCHAADLVLARDAATRAQLAHLGYPDAVVVGCPSLFLNEAVPVLPPAEEGLDSTVLISIRHPALMSVPNSVRGRLDAEIRRLIEFFRGEGQEVRLLCHDYQDLAYAQAFPDVLSMYTEDPHRFLSWLRSCALNVTFRLHAFLACLALGAPSVPLTYDERGMSLIETVGMSEWKVCFVHSADVLDEVKQRCRSLSRLRELTAETDHTRARLRGAMIDGFEQFVATIEERRRHLRF